MNLSSQAWRLPFREFLQRLIDRNQRPVLFCKPTCPTCGRASQPPTRVRFVDTTCPDCGESFLALGCSLRDIQDPHTIRLLNQPTSIVDGEPQDPVQDDTRNWIDDLLTDHRIRLRCARITRQLDLGEDQSPEDLAVIAQALLSVTGPNENGHARS